MLRLAALAGAVALLCAPAVALPLPIVGAGVAAAQEAPAPALQPIAVADDPAAVTVVAPSDGVVVVDNGDVPLPVGDWLSGLADAIKAGIMALLLILARHLPKSLYDIFQTWRVEQLLQKALDYAENATIGAMKSKVLTVNVGSEVVAKGLRFAIENGASKVIAFAGGEDGLIMKLIARIKVNEGALDEREVKRAVAAGADRPGVSMTPMSERPA